MRLDGNRLAFTEYGALSTDSKVIEGAVNADAARSAQFRSALAIFSSISRTRCSAPSQGASSSLGTRRLSGSTAS